MSGRKPRGGPRPLRRLTLCVECLDTRELLSIGIGHPVGKFLAPATSQPRVPGPAPTVDPNLAVNKVLTSLIGPSLTTFIQQANSHGLLAQGPVNDKIVTQPYINAVLSDYDTYVLLQSPALTGLVGTSQTGSSAQTTDTVTYFVPQANLVIGPVTSTVTVPASNGADGFITQVPTSNIRLLPDQLASVQIPRSSIPSGAPIPSQNVTTTGSLGDVFTSTGPLLVEALSTGSGQQGPTAPPTVPGLRLIRALSHNQNFSGASGARFLHMFRVAVDRKLFDLSPGQQNQVITGVTQFTTTVNALNQVGTFQPAVPSAPPTQVKGALGGTLQVSFGALRQLADVASPISGLQLPGIGNFPGRIDIGYVFARNGDFGLVLTARGPLQSAPAGLTSANLVGSDVRIEISNAPSLAALNGKRTVEGFTLGSVQTGGLGASTNETGVHTSSASVGYATGFEFGTGVAYTQVIPLGNVFALIPEAPRR